MNPYTPLLKAAAVPAPPARRNPRSRLPARKPPAGSGHTDLLGLGQSFLDQLFSLGEQGKITPADQHHMIKTRFDRLGGVSPAARQANERNSYLTSFMKNFGLGGDKPVTGGMVPGSGDVADPLGFGKDFMSSLWELGEKGRMTPQDQQKVIQTQIARNGGRSPVGQAAHERNRELEATLNNYGLSRPKKPEPGWLRTAWNYWF